MPYDQDLWRGDCFVVTHSDNAMLVNHENEEYWIPYSQVNVESDLHAESPAGEAASLLIPYWLAEKAGWA